MAQTLLRYRKSIFFIGILTTLAIFFTWDYPGYFPSWSYLGLPLVVATVYVLYALMYWKIYPYLRTKKSAVPGIALGILTIASFSVFFYLINRFTVSDAELRASFDGVSKSINEPERVYTPLQRKMQLFLGSIFTSLLFYFMSWVIVHWHRKKNIRVRVRRWWRNLYLSTSGLHILYLSFGWIFWLFFTLSPTLFTGKPIAWQTTILMILPSILFFYINLKTSFNLLAENRAIMALLVTLCLWGALLFIKSFWFLVLIKGFGLPAILDGKSMYEADIAGKGATTFQVGKSLGTMLAGSAFKELIILLGSFIYGYGRRVAQYRNEMIAMIETRQQEQLKQQVLEKEVVDARLQSLKYQINPHFLFNSLNFLYSQSLPLSDDLARATMLLSKMMRYGLQENSEEAKVSLAGEVEHLRNFMEFNQLRFSNQLQVEFKLAGQVSIRRIMPLLLITFVENAFKYGELHQPENPLRIHLSVDSEKLIFFVKNKKRNGPKEDSTGIGLENIRRRLALGYPGKHSLIITDTVDFYQTDLTIIL